MSEPTNSGIELWDEWSGAKRVVCPNGCGYHVTVLAAADEFQIDRLRGKLAAECPNHEPTDAEADGVRKWIDVGASETTAPLTAEVLDATFRAIRDRRDDPPLHFAHSDAEEAHLVERYGRDSVVRAMTLHDLFPKEDR